MRYSILELTQPVPASAVITGNVTNINTSPDNTVVNIAVTAALLDTPAEVAASTVTDANGNYTLPSVANGVYIVSAFFTDADGSTLSGAVDVTVAGANVTAPTLSLVRSASAYTSSQLA